MEIYLGSNPQVIHSLIDAFAGFIKVKEAEAAAQGTSFTMILWD
jgi:hypothetical protein